MLKIRLARGGRKKVPFYRIVVANVTASRDGKFLEKVGTYDPALDVANKNRIVIDKERVEYWLSVGAIPTDRVSSFLCSLGVVGAEKHKPKFIAKNKGDGLKKKALEKIAKEKEAAETALKEAEEAKIAAENAAKEAREAEIAAKAEPEAAPEGSTSEEQSA